MPTNKLLLCCSLAWIGAATPASAARLTQVADAADTVVIDGVARENLFDLQVETRWELEFHSSTITREPINRTGVISCPPEDIRGCLPVDELKSKRTRHQLRYLLEMGLFHDLALTFGWSTVLDDKRNLRLAKDVTASSVNPDLFAVPYTSHESGTGPFELGLRFAPLNDERDRTKPTWVLYFNWRMPWPAPTRNPSNPGTAKNPGSVGDGVHYLTFGTSFSKRLGSFGSLTTDLGANRRGYLDPYLDFSYTKPVPAEGRALDAHVRSKANPFGRRPSERMDLAAGMEIVAVEDLRKARKVAIDLGVRSTYFGEGRNLSELSNALGAADPTLPAHGLTFTQEYFYIAGFLGLNIQAAAFLHFNAGVSVGGNTEHFLTTENAGKDANGDGQVDASVPGGEGDIDNVYFNPEVDQVGFRLKDDEHLVIGTFVGARLTF